MIVQIEIEVDGLPSIERLRKIEDAIKENTKISKPYNYSYRISYTIDQYIRK